MATVSSPIYESKAWNHPSWKWHYRKRTDISFLLITCCKTRRPPRCRTTFSSSLRVLLSRNSLLSRRRQTRSEEHTSELQSRGHLVCRLLLEKKKKDGRNNRRTKAI